jgi:hypothetical protein
MASRLGRLEHLPDHLLERRPERLPGLEHPQEVPAQPPTMMSIRLRW